MADATNRCPKCGHENPSASGDCENCGITFDIYKMEKERAQVLKVPAKHADKTETNDQPDNLTACPNCGQPTDLSSEDCLSCGIVFAKYYEIQERKFGDDPQKLAELHQHKEEHEKAVALRHEQEAAEKAERQKREAAEIAERRKREAAEKAERLKREAAEKAERLKREAAEKAERLKREAAEKAEQLRREKIERERADALKKQKTEQAQADTARLQAAAKERQQALEQQQAEFERRQAELEQAAEKEKLAELEQQKAAHEKIADEKQQRAAAEKLAELEQQQAEFERRQAELEQAAEKEKLAELEQQKAAYEQSAAENRQRAEAALKAALEQQKQDLEANRHMAQLQALSENLPARSGIRQRLQPYEGQTAGINLSDPSTLDPAVLVSVGEDHFSMLDPDTGWLHSFPFTAIASVVEATAGIPVGKGEHARTVFLAVKILHPAG